MNRFIKYSVVMAFISVPFLVQAETFIKSKIIAEDAKTLLNLNVTERTQVMQDILVASLRCEVSGADAAVIQQTINDTIQKAIHTAQQVPQVEISTGAYYVYMESQEPIQATTTPSTTKWRGQQSIDLKSKDASSLLTLVGQLQQAGLLTSQLSYSLSNEAAEQAQAGLMSAAFAKLQAKADQAGLLLKKKHVSLLEVSIDEQQVFAPRMMRTMAMSDGAAKNTAPVAAPDQTEVSLSLSARALLQN